MLTSFLIQSCFNFRLLILSCLISFGAIAAEGSTQIKSEPGAETQLKKITTKEKEDLKKPVVIQDLAYGSILFEYYRGNKIAALNAILIAEKKKLLANHSQSARLLSGVIYLDLRMVSHAKAIFDELLTEEDLRAELLSQIEFYLGKLHYRQGDYQQANYRLERSLNALVEDIKDECLIMLSNMALARGQLSTAKNWLTQVSENSKLAAFTRYNLGIVLLQENNLIEAEKLLIDIYQLNKKSNKRKKLNKTDKSLQDKARVALGYYYLTRDNYAKARQVFALIRLDSLQSNKALLGMGWSHLESGSYQKALSHWNELQQRDIRDIAVQEALLAIPYAYHKLGSMQEALDSYVLASEKYQQQINLIDELNKEIDEGLLIEKFIDKIISKQLIIDSSGIEDSRLFGDKFDYYLFELISQHNFNEKFRNYQKLGQLSNILNYWDEQLPLFNNILQTNQQRFEEKLPLTNLYLQEGSFDAAQKSLSEIQESIRQIKNNNQLSVLASETELDIILRINRVVENIQRIPSEMINNQQRLKLVRAQGIMKWQLQLNKAEKLWQLEKNATKVSEILEEIEQRKSKLLNAKSYAQNRFAGFEESVKSGKGQLYSLKNKIGSQVDFQSEELKSLIKTVLTERKSVLENFLLQADLSIARLHEKAVVLPEAN